jgi:hypothetical protein
MIRLIQHKTKDYIVINTDIKAGELTAPVKIIISLVGIDTKDHYTLYKHASVLLDREIKLATPKLKPTKPWYKFW